MFNKCLGCGVRLPSDARGRGQHRRHCAKMKTAALAHTLRERQAEEARERELRELEQAEREIVDAAQGMHMSNDEWRESPSWTKHRSSTNMFGLYREYPIKPQRDPEEKEPPLESACDPIAFGVKDAHDIQPPIQNPDNASPGSSDSSSDSEDSIPDPPPWAPFPNVSTCDMLSWQNNDSNSKSNAQINLLTRDVFQQPGFNLADLAQFDAAREAQRLDDYVDKVDGSPLSAMDGWMKSSVYVRLPKEGVSFASEEEAPIFTISDVWHRSLPQVIRSALQRPGMKTWHMIPHKLFCARPSQPHQHPSHSASPSTPHFFSQSTSSSSPSPSSSSRCFTNACSPSAGSPSRSPEPREDTRVYSELYNSDAALDEYDQILEQDREQGDPEDLEYSMTIICWYSDGTRLTNFGPASMWPLYNYFGNQSKYERVRPSLYPAHHLAYIPSLPDLIQDVYTEIYGIPATAAVLTFLKRELMQAIILLILDTDGFMYVYVHGQIVDCGDGIRRRDFPRFFIWSADYVEKVLLACIKYLARCHCPRCRINKDHTIGLGTRADIFRRNKLREDNDDVIFERGMPLTSVYIDRLLGDLSLTPTRSAMSLRLRDHGFNHYSLFVPDFLHEFELGVWKSILTHFMRLLYAAGGDKIQLFNKRFRQVPTFGRSTIRRFSTNVSDQGKLAARDYEDRLQCFMPVWEALLPSADDRITSDLTFDCAMFLSLGKLRYQVPETLDSLDDAADNIGSDVRTFVKKTCKKYHTVELPREAAARGRREARLTAQGKNSTSTKSSGVSASRKVKMFNPRTYKLHALRDYACTCRMFGSTDNTTTQTGECEHCRVKRWYERTNKHKHVGQIARHTRRADKLNIVQMRVDGWRAKLCAKKYGDKRTKMRAQHANIPVPGTSSEGIVGCSPELHYHIAESRRNPINIPNWTYENKGDTALTDFSINLQTHLLARLADRSIGPLDGPDQDSAEFSFSDHSRLIIHHSQMYPHQILRLNYTTYDLRRCQDIINPRTHGDIMLISGAPLDEYDSSSAHGFEYARVIKIFHVNVRLADSQMSAFERMDVLFVRWFRVDHSVAGGFKAKRLYRLEFTPTDNDDGIAFGFVDPSDVVRASHIIPAFAHGRTEHLLGPSVARDVAGQSQILSPDDAEHTDFRYHYVNFFADRDMFMRYYGGGIGHRGNARSRALETAMDDEDIASEWQDIDPDLAEAQAAEEAYAQQIAQEPDALLRLVPELAGDAEDGARTAALFEEAVRTHTATPTGCDLVYDDSGEPETSDTADSDEEFKHDAGNEEGLDVVDQDGNQVLDEYDLEGYAPP
ncbi:hypothetical protein C8Q80DRAFT_1339217 [Daedaleopsis nitida]|nr:hypothetical protein C8Q80DRAFT_1339217 [Daedaleopsis nitida]